jgi:hypothetical protein
LVIRFFSQGVFVGMDIFDILGRNERVFFVWEIDSWFFGGW